MMDLDSAEPPAHLGEGELSPHLDTLPVAQPDRTASFTPRNCAPDLEPPESPGPGGASGRGSLLTCGDVEQNSGPSRRGSLLTCGDVEENPGPPELASSADASALPSATAMEPSDPQPPPGQSMDVDGQGNFTGLTQDISRLSLPSSDLPPLPGDLFPGGLPATPAPTSLPAPLPVEPTVPGRWSCPFGCPDKSWANSQPCLTHIERTHLAGGETLPPDNPWLRAGNRQICQPCCLLVPRGPSVACARSASISPRLPPLPKLARAWAKRFSETPNGKTCS